MSLLRIERGSGEGGSEGGEDPVATAGARVIIGDLMLEDKSPKSKESTKNYFEQEMVSSLANFSDKPRCCFQFNLNGCGHATREEEQDETSLAEPHHVSETLHHNDPA